QTAVEADDGATVDPRQHRSPSRAMRPLGWIVAHGIAREMAGGEQSARAGGSHEPTSPGIPRQGRSASVKTARYLHDQADEPVAAPFQAAGLAVFGAPALARSAAAAAATFGADPATAVAAGNASDDLAVDAAFAGRGRGVGSGAGESAVPGAA